MTRTFPSFSPSLKKWLVLTVRVVVLIALLAYAFARVDVHELQRELMHSRWSLVLVGTLLVGSGIPIAAWRWQMILAGLGAPLRFEIAARLTLIGLFLSQFLPGMVGSDAARIWLTMQAGCGVKDAFNSVAIDRLMMVLVLLVLAVLAIPGLANQMGIDHLQWAAVLLLAATVLGTALLMSGDRLPRRLQRWRAFRAVGYLAADARRIFLSWPLSAALLGISLLSYLAMVGAMYCFAGALGPISELWSFALLVPPVLLVSTLPLSIGGWGTREVAAVLLWGTVGVEAGRALLISVLFGAATLLVSLPGIFFFRSGRAARISPVPASPAAGSTTE
jgi:glycosyltransferase 2 family protein